MTTEPQSIIHKVIRVSSKLCKSLPRRRSTGQLLDKNQDDQSVTTLSSDTFHTSASSECLTMMEQESLSFRSIVGDSDNYRTIDQVEFMDELVVHSPDELCFILFYRSESYFSDNLDKHMKELSKRFPNRRFYRINKNLSPIITSKLGITSKNPTVVAMRSGKVVNKISEFSSVDCSELQQWVSTIQLLSP